jgi:predicted PurR-regulated permease PerM
VLHHIGLLAGTAFVAGSSGTILFGLIGIAASIPLLLRLKKRFGSRWAPIIGLAAFAFMFSLSAFVIGPAITNGGSQPPIDQPSPSPQDTEHHP